MVFEGRVNPEAVLCYMVGEVLKSLFQIDQTMDQGFHVSPVVLPISLPLRFHPIDMLVENLPRRVAVFVRPVVVSHQVTQTP